MTPDDRTTQERLVSAGMRLFAERGFRGTTVGDIEAAAGLSPRSGALYKHFASKRALLEAALERHVRELESMEGVIDLLPLGDLRSELTLLVRWLLMELSRQRDVCRVLEKEGDQFPELLTLFRERVIQRGYRQAAELTRRWVKDAGEDGVDADGLAAVMVGAVVNFRTMAWGYGAPPLDLDEERFTRAWVEACMRLAR